MLSFLYVYSDHSILECYNLFSGVKLSMRSFFVIICLFSCIFVDCFIMLSDGVGYDDRNTVAQSDSIPIENFVEIMTFMEVFVNKHKENFCKICLNILALWSVEPNRCFFYFFAFFSC